MKISKEDVDMKAVAKTTGGDSGSAKESPKNGADSTTTGMSEHDQSKTQKPHETTSTTTTIGKSGSTEPEIESPTNPHQGVSVGIPGFMAGDEHTITTNNLEPLPLIRGPDPRPRNATQPGAYAGGLGGRMDRVNNLDLSLVGNHPEVPVPNGLTAIVENHLAQAREVDDENPDRNLPQAREYDPNNRKKKSQSNRAIGIMIVLAMLALLLSLYFGIKNNSKSSQNDVKEEEIQMTPTTPSPSLSPSAAPSAIMDDLIEMLPNFTHTSLQNYSSPQFQAWQWLEAHHNITAMPTWQKEQLFAMATFFYAMDGPNWAEPAKEKWMDYKVSECLWFSTVTGGVDENGKWTQTPHLTIVNDFNEEVAAGQPTNCDGQGLMKAIALAGVGVRSTYFPPELGLLSSLEVLDLTKNWLGGRLESFIRPEYAPMGNLLHVSLRNNRLEGPLPTSIGALSNVQTFSLLGNSFTGTIPSEIGRLASLETISLALNELTGTLPTELGSLRNLTAFVAEKTLLSGTIPTELGHSISLGDLFLSNTPYLTGPIPSELGRLTRLTRLYLRESSVTGTIPTELGLLTMMKSLVVDDCTLTGVIPSELGLMEPLQYLAVSGNDLTGAIPSEILYFDSVIRISLGSNPLSGTIPTQIGLLHPLTWLSLEETHLSGDIPSEIGLLTAMRRLHLSNNAYLTGSLPTEIGLLTDLFELHLANNTQLTGTLPLELDLLVTSFNLSVVDLEGTDMLTGEIQDGVCFLKSPSCTYKPELWSDPTPCTLEFDCFRGALCGCDCSCPDI